MKDLCEKYLWLSKVDDNNFRHWPLVALCVYRIVAGILSSYRALWPLVITLGFNDFIDSYKNPNCFIPSRLSINGQYYYKAKKSLHTVFPHHFLSKSVLKIRQKTKFISKCHYLPFYPQTRCALQNSSFFMPSRLRWWNSNGEYWTDIRNPKGYSKIKIQSYFYEYRNKFEIRSAPNSITGSQPPKSKL